MLAAAADAAGLRIVVVAVLVAAANAVLVAHQVHPATWAVRRVHDAHKASTRRLHARLAYVVRVDNHASVAYVATTPAV
jgi:hypothetical protein